MYEYTDLLNTVLKFIRIFQSEKYLSNDEGHFQSNIEQVARLYVSAYPASLLRYLMHAPPYGHVWHKAFFWVGSLFTACSDIFHSPLY